MGDRVNEECEILHELRASPRLLDLIGHADGGELRLQKQLRQEFSSRLVRAALTLTELREKAVAKFSRGAEMWFDRKSLEQATSEAVARHKAKRFDGTVWDFCCGAGSDSIALADYASVKSVDSNPAACLRTEWNADIYGVADRLQVVCADVEKLQVPNSLVHIDPDRRASDKGQGRGRSIRVEDGVPNLEYLQQMMRKASGGAIKLSPASNFMGKFPNAEIELVSLGGECKEATVWFGELKSSQPWRATVLPAGETIAGDPLASFVEVSPLGDFLYEPDPAVVRAGLVNQVAEMLNLSRLDDEEEYLTSTEFVVSPFVRGFEVVAELANNDHEIRKYFRSSRFGQVEIKCRHIPINAEEIRRKLPLPGDQPAVLIFARIGEKSRAVICRRLSVQ